MDFYRLIRDNSNQSFLRILALGSAVLSVFISNILPFLLVEWEGIRINSVCGQLFYSEWSAKALAKFTRDIVSLMHLDIGIANVVQVFHRVFPIARGLFEDKVGNFWFIF